MFAGVFEVLALPLAWFFSVTHSYSAAIALVAVLIMVIVTPLTLKSTKGMLEMQRLAPEMKRLQNEHRDDRTKLNEEMMKLYQEHKVNPMASCLPLVIQMPVFIIMFRILHGLTYKPAGGNLLVAQAVLDAAGDTSTPGFLPRYLALNSELFQSLVRQTKMESLGLDLALSPAQALGEGLGKGSIYALLVALLGCLYFFQQRMVAARAAVSPTMSEGQQKLMQYLPVFFAIFQVFFLLGLVVYYMVQAVLRIIQQFYITRRFYGHDESLGRQAQAASVRARELSQKDDSGGGPLAKAKRDLAAAKDKSKDQSKEPPKAAKKGSDKGAPEGPRPTKRTTAPKNRPTPTKNRTTSRPASQRPGGASKKSKKR